MSSIQSTIHCDAVAVPDSFKEKLDKSDYSTMTYLFKRQTEKNKTEYKKHRYKYIGNAAITGGITSATLGVIGMIIALPIVAVLTASFVVVGPLVIVAPFIFAPLGCIAAAALAALVVKLRSKNFKAEKHNIKLIENKIANKEKLEECEIQLVYSWVLSQNQQELQDLQSTKDEITTFKENLSHDSLIIDESCPLTKWKNNSEEFKEQVFDGKELLSIKKEILELIEEASNTKESLTQALTS